MKQKNLIFYSQLLLAPIIMCAHIGIADAAVAQRTAVKRTTSAAPAARSTSGATTTTTTNPVVEPEPTPEPEPEVMIQDKSSQFSTTSSFTNESDNDSALAAKIRAQRAAADAAVADEINTNTIKSSVSGNARNKCDENLRKCMTDKCGTDFAGCAGDTDTTWGNKIELCRPKSECTAHEYAMFAPEIKADRDMAQKISGYNAIVKCGNDYNNCIATQCGPTFMKCIGKKSGDTAIAACEKVAKQCIQQDSGLAARSSSVFATLREISEIQVQKDEKYLYDLRDKMRTQCSFMGAMFDERSLDCVYTIDFFANNSETPYASKKAYAGSTFNCNPDYFGIDITTFKENAYRLTRAQTAASSAMLGSGVGMGVGALTSGAIGRAVDRTKAEKDLKKTCKESGGEYDSKTSTCKMPDDTDTKKEQQKDDSQNPGTLPTSQTPTPNNTHVDQNKETSTPTENGGGDETEILIKPASNALKSNVTLTTKPLETPGSFKTPPTKLNLPTSLHVPQKAPFTLGQNSNNTK